jgi:hypothetical protein
VTEEGPSTELQVEVEKKREEQPATKGTKN